MRRLLGLAAAGMLAALAVTATAPAKGPASASITGPGLGKGIAIKGEGEGGPGTPLGSLVQFGGYFAQVFDPIPNPTTRTRPTWDLGPRYSVVYRVPGPNGGASTLIQDVYPYANPPVTYMASGQRVFGNMRTHGGWFLSEPALKAALVKAGLPESPPSPASGGSFRWTWLGAGVGIVVVVLLLALVLRRRGIAWFRTVKSAA